MQQLLDALKAADKAYTANEGQETYNIRRNASEGLYKAIWDALVDGKTIRISGESYYLVHEIKPEYTETICVDSTGWLWYVDNERVVHHFSLSTADKVVVI